MTEDRVKYQTERYTIICGTCARKFLCPWRHEKRETCHEYETERERPKPPGPERPPTGYWTGTRQVPVVPRDDYYEAACQELAQAIEGTGNPSETFAAVADVLAGMADIIRRNCGD